MSTPSVFERHAVPLHPYRWWLGGASLLVYCLMFGLAALLNSLPIRLPFSGVYLLMALAPALVWCWGLMLVGVWFHPAVGIIRTESPWFLRAPRFLQAAIRWYAAVFLVIWFAIPILVAGVIALSDASEAPISGVIHAFPRSE